MGQRHLKHTQFDGAGWVGARARGPGLEPEPAGHCVGGLGDCIFECVEIHGAEGNALQADGALR